MEQDRWDRVRVPGAGWGRAAEARRAVCAKVSARDAGKEWGVARAVVAVPG